MNDHLLITFPCFILLLKRQYVRILDTLNTGYTGIETSTVEVMSGQCPANVRPLSGHWPDIVRTSNGHHLPDVRWCTVGRAEGALRISATTPVGPARLSLYGTGRRDDGTFHGCAVILQTCVGVPDRPSNRGVFPGGPETLENLVRVGVLCLGGTQPGG